MSDHLSTWHCPECGQVSYYWHFDAPDGWALTAELASLPDMSSMEAAKAKALAEHEQLRQENPAWFPDETISKP